MNKKVLYALLLCIAIFFIGTVCCFAESNSSSSTDLGNEVDSSVKTTEKSVDNLVATNTSDSDAKSNVTSTGDEAKTDTEDLRK